MNWAAAASRPELVVAPALAVLGLLFASVVAAPSLTSAVVGLVAVGLLALTHSRLLRWQNLLALTILVILLIPIRRYEMPGELPFELEPYRLLVAFLAVGWIASLLVDPRVRLRRTVLDGPIGLVVVAAALSITANGDRIHELHVSETVLKKLSFLLSFVIVFFLIASVVRRLDEIDLLLRVLVGGGALIAAFGLIETQTGSNAFNGLSSFLPFLTLVEVVDEGTVSRGGHLRAYASAQHPIALGAMLVMLVPLAIYLARKTGRLRWWGAATLLCLGMLATLSRTGVLMLLVIGLVFLWLRPAAVKRLWPLALPALVAVHLALPGTLGTFRELFFPAEGIVAQQSDAAVGSGRVASLGPALDEAAKTPVLGQGYGTRVVEGPNANAFIVDNGWLSTLLETGVLGVVAWFVVFHRSVRRLARRGREDDSHTALLACSLAASIAAYAVGMFTYDAFSFIQVTFGMVILLGLTAALLASEDESRRPAVLS